MTNDPWWNPNAGEGLPPQRPGPAVPADPGRAHTGLLVAGVGGAIALLSFLALPTATFPLLGGVRMPSFISVLSEFEPAFSYLWLVAAGAGFVTACGLWLGLSRTVAPGLRLRAAGAVETVSFFVALAYVLVPFLLADDLSAELSVKLTTSILDIGYYAAALGMIVAFIASVVATRELRRR